LASYVNNRHLPASHAKGTQHHNPADESQQLAQNERVVEESLMGIRSTQDTSIYQEMA
jgi:coproporphyrinogen III oxidase-like Fe-S oxidoreductase